MRKRLSMRNSQCAYQCAIRNAQNPSVKIYDFDSSPFKGAEKAVAPTEHYNAIAGNSGGKRQVLPAAFMCYCLEYFSCPP